MKKSNSKSFTNSLSFAKIKEKTSRFSLTIVIFFFVFGILLLVISLTALGLLILTETNVIVDEEGGLKLGPVLLFMSLISLFIGGVITFFASRIPLKPVNDIINKMNRLAAGDFKTRLEFNKSASQHPAIKEFTDSFNTMAEELENTEMLRNDFINNFSHEFKTPIVSIAGLAKLVNKGDLDEEQRSQYLNTIESESLRLADMATNVLNLTKVENQTILSEITEYNLSEQIRSCVLLLENKWTQKDIGLSLDFDEINIEGNEELLKQIWINLTDNAIKFSPKGGTVTIEIEEDSEYTTVRVKNTGSEISEADRRKIWNKFYQADKSHTTEGNGIGLAIVKRIVDLHGGEVGVESGNGEVCFYVVLPCEQL